MCLQFLRLKERKDGQADFESPTAMTSPFDRTVGSTNRALRELAEMRATDLTLGAAETLTQALADSAQLHLPMIVDW
jgi:predicted HAD superfamily phosphohydrolase